MFKGKRVTAIITAAGSGKRMGYDVPKQFLNLGSKTVLEMSIAPFDKADFIDEILVVTNQDFLELCKTLCQNYHKVVRILEGGKERQDSVKNALDLLEDGYVLVHDGARPYVTEEIIMNVMMATAEKKAAVAAVPAKDTIRQVSGKNSVTLDRSTLYNVQTPQGFSVPLIKKAFQKAYEDNFYGTDDAMLVERIGADVAIAEGSYGNIKITTKEDLPVDMRVGSGFDVHRLIENRSLILCGVKIPFERGLLGHSDADVAIHALMDAMLGAAALGDIGKHFPDTDDNYKGISSVLLLKKVNELIAELGYKVNNVDITIMAQVPKLLPYIQAMREKIAEILEIDESRVNVKATTTEKLGFVGREEGIAAEAVCTINRG
jgi:2-C-methyl-D-erythritol 2,4-cyclodiphosphate synthase/2-C-methyl-D-erythritol 4-phosphate cytidylyltransferase